MTFEKIDDFSESSYHLCKYDNKYRDKHEFLSKRISELGTGLIPLVNYTEKCICKKTCDEACLNRLNRCECNKSICGLSDSRHYVYCNNRPFQRLNNKKLKFSVEKYKYKNELEVNDKNDIKANISISHVSTRLILLESVSKGELIIECKGEILTNKDIRDRYSCYFELENTDKRLNYFKEVKGIPTKLFCLVDNFVYLDMTEKGNEARHIRHSCEPNSRAEVWISIPHASLLEGRIRDEFSITWLKMGIFALKNLEKGTEITIDFEDLISRCIPGEKKVGIFDYFGMFECHCNSKKCRRTIGTRNSLGEYNTSGFSTPVKHEDRTKFYSNSYSTNEINTIHKDSFKTYIDIKHRLTRSQRKWKEKCNKKQIKSVDHKVMDIFEYDKNKIIEIQRNINEAEKTEMNALNIKNEVPLWYLYTLISWQGLQNIKKCCKEYLPHNDLYNQFYSFYSLINKHSNLYQFKRIERPKRTCSKKIQIYRLDKITQKYDSEIYKFTGKRSIFLHLMTHPWYMALNNHTNVDIELGRTWNSFLVRSIYLGRLYVIQRLSIFFNINKVHDEDLSWPLIDHGIGDDEKCIVCSLHGTLFSCDVCFRGIHKTCLNKANQFISSPSFRLPDWFQMKDIKRESYFSEFTNIFFKKKVEDESDRHNIRGSKNLQRITVIYNPSTNPGDSSEISKKSANSEILICHICRNSLHSKFWISQSGRKRRLISTKSMKMRIIRTYLNNFYGKPVQNNKSKVAEHKYLKELKKHCFKAKPQRTNQIRTVRIMISNMFMWRRNNYNSRIHNYLLSAELLRDYIKKREIDPRWNFKGKNPSSKSSNFNFDNKSCKNRQKSHIESHNLSISKLKPIQILDSIPFKEYVKKTHIHSKTCTKNNYTCINSTANVNVHFSRI